MIKRIAFNLQKKVEDGEVIIEGYANKAVADDVGDLVDPKGMDLTRFNKNPMILYNHDPFYPVGMALKIEGREDGVWIRAKISKSKNAIVSFVREMVAEGILKTFSIGFRPVEEVKGANGENVISKWKLHEVSVVALPMNEDSTFAMVKSYKSKFDKCLDDNDILSAKKLTLQIKGSALAAAIHARVFEMVEATPDLDKEKLLEELKESTKLSDQDFDALITGDKVELSAEQIDSIAQALGLDSEAFNALVKAQEEKPKEEDDEDGKPKEDDEEGKADPKQEDGDDDGDDEEVDKDFQECVASKIPKLVEEGKPQDEAVAIAISMCESEGKCSIVALTKTDIEYATNLAKECAEANAEVGKEKNTNEAPTVPLSNDTENNTRSSEPHLELLRSLLALQGEVIGLLKTISSDLNSINNKMFVASNNENQENNSQDIQQPQENEEEKAFFSGLEKKIKMLEDRLGI